MKQDKAWSTTETAQLEKLHDSDDMTWEQIGEILARSPESCRSHYRHSVQGVLMGTRKKLHNVFNKNDDVTVDEDENHKQVEYNGKRITSPDELLEHMKIDLDVWMIERVLTNKWEVGTKYQDTDITYNDGTPDGHIVKKPEVIVEPLFQVKVWLRKRVPEKVQIHLQPVVIDFSKIKFPKPTKTNNSGNKRILIWGDPHFGYRRNMKTGILEAFHDRRALDIIAQVLDIDYFDEAVCLGDVLDLPDFSDKFRREPEFCHTTQPATIEASYWFSRFRNSKKSNLLKQHTILGNHGMRLKNSVIDNLSAAYSIAPHEQEDTEYPLISLPTLLDLNNIGVEYHEEDLWLTDDLCCSHGDIARGNAGATARAMLERESVSRIFGHIHSTEYLMKKINTRNKTKWIYAYSPGCTCKIERGLVPGFKGSQQWSQGFGVVDIGAGGIFNITNYNICEGKAMYNGQLIKATDTDKVAEQLHEETKWRFI